MRRVALATLRHDLVRTVLLVAGLASAWALVTVQLGLRRGFELASRGLLDHVGGDVWVSARGVKVIDDAEPVLASVLPVSLDPCVLRRRPLVVDFAQVRLSDGSLVTVQIVGVDPASRDRVPWSVLAGVRGEIDSAGLVGIDAADVSRLELKGQGMGQELRLRTGVPLRVGVVSRGARNFTQTPYVFVDIETARRVLGLPSDGASFWVLDLRDPSCAPAVSRSIQGPSLAAPTREELALSTTRARIDGSGIGLLLTVGSLMAGAVGAAALLQSTMTLVRTHLREIATIRALGARRSELAVFVAWQAGIVSVLAAVLALALASALAKLLEGAGLSVVVDAWSWAVGLGIALTSTITAALVGARLLGRVDPREVLE